MSKKTQKVLASALAAAMASMTALAAGGCSLTGNTVLAPSDSEVQSTLTVSAEADDVEKAFREYLVKTGTSELEADAITASLPEYCRFFGVEYRAASESAEATYSLTESDTGEMKPYSTDTFTIYTKEIADTVSDMTDAASAETIEQIAALLGDKPLEVGISYSFGSLKPVDTNLEDAGNGTYKLTASITAAELVKMMSGEASLTDKIPPVVYARFNDKALTTSTVTTSAKGGYTAYNQLRVYTPGIIKTVSVNGKSAGCTDIVNLGKDGKKKVTVSLENGNSKTVTVTADTASPTANVKYGKTYKSGKKVTFKDKTSGVKSAKLDGKKIKSGKKVTKKGSHKLVVTDRAGNSLTVKFRVK